MKKLLLILSIIVNCQLSIVNSQNPYNLGTMAPKGSFPILKIYDGDTFTILTPDGRRFNIRINGIDAPERTQEDGMYAREYLVQLINNERVTIYPLSIDRYGRTLATCYTYDGRDIALEMLQAGMAWHYALYDNTAAYIKAEQTARYTGEGIWANANAIDPQTYRTLTRIQKLKHQ